MGSIKSAISFGSDTSVFTAPANNQKQDIISRTFGNSPGKRFIDLNATVFLFPGFSAIYRFVHSFPKSARVQSSPFFSSFKINENMGHRSFTYITADRSPRFSSVFGDQNSALVPGGTISSEHFRSCQVVRSTHGSPGFSFYARIKG